MQSLLANYPSITEIPVAWGEMDALQHINNTVYFRYFETARIDYFKKIKLLLDLKQHQIGPVLSHTECRYKIPVTFPDTLLIGTKIFQLQDDRFTMEYCVMSKKSGKITTTGNATCVMFDFKNQVKVSIPEHIKQRIISTEQME